MNTATDRNMLELAFAEFGEAIALYNAAPNDRTLEIVQNAWKASKNVVRVAGRAHQASTVEDYTALTDRLELEMNELRKEAAFSARAQVGAELSVEDSFKLNAAVMGWTKDILDKNDIKRTVTTVRTNSYL